MEFVRVGVDCVAFWSCHCCYVLVGLAIQDQASSTVETFLEVSVAQEWRYETNRWIFGQCWIIFSVGDLVLAVFGCGEVLPIAITTLVHIVFILYLVFP